MKTLIVYYSRTGNTKKIAETIARELNFDIAEIKETKKITGIIGWLLAGKNALLKKTTAIGKMHHNIADYDLIILGTPVWANTMASPARTFLYENSTQIKKMICFVTMGGANNDKNTFLQIQDMCKKPMLLTAAFTANDIKKQRYQAFLYSFILQIKDMLA